jgi:phage terminase large subunit-like protein
MANEKKDYVQIARDYAARVIADERLVPNPKKDGELVAKRTNHCKWEVLAAKRFLADLERCGTYACPFTFDGEIAAVFCDFIERLPHVEGKWKKKTIELVPAQIFILVQLFGFRNLDGGRRFTTFLLAIARKNAKSTLAAAILIACWCLEDEMEPQAISAATTGSQARIVWNIAKKMLEKTPDLCSAFKLRPRANDIQGKSERGGFFKPINAKASTQDGLNPTYTVLDEMHAHKTHDLLNVLMSAGGARSNPLWMYTTTEGYETPGPWPEQRTFAESVLEGTIVADHYLALIYCVDDEDDDFDETAWPKANPLMSSNPLILKVNREMAIEAKAMPGKLAEFRIKRLNRRSSVANGFIDMMKWNACKGTIDLKELEGYPCMAALDLASVTDMCAWRFVWELEENELYATWGRFFVPEAQVKLRTIRNTIPYAGWVAAEHLVQTEGEVTDYGFIRDVILDDCERFNPENVAYDPWNATHLASELDDEGVPLVQFIQGTRSYNPAMKYFEELYLSRKIIHDGNPILKWNMSNLVVRKDVNENIAPDRKRAKEKIDGAITLIMGCGLFAAKHDEYVKVHRKKAS